MEELTAVSSAADVMEKLRQVKIDKALYRFNSGTLSFEEFKKLKKFAQQIYVRHFGRPQTLDDMRGIKRKVAQARRRKKDAGAARRTNR